MPNPATTADHHGRNLRKGRHSESGHVYLLTAVTHERRHVFNA